MAETAAVIRRLERTDAGAYRRFRVAALERDPLAFTTSASEAACLPLAWYETRIAACVIGAFAGHELVGTVCLETAAEGCVGHLKGLAVDPGWRGAGLGRRLVEAALYRARQAPDLTEIRLSVTDGQAAASSLYQSLGFAVSGRERRLTFSGEHRDKVLMVLRLGGSS